MFAILHRFAIIRSFYTRVYIYDPYANYRKCEILISPLINLFIVDIRKRSSLALTTRAHVFPTQTVHHRLCSFRLPSRMSFFPLFNSFPDSASGRKEVRGIRISKGTEWPCCERSYPFYATLQSRRYALTRLNYDRVPRSCKLERIISSRIARKREGNSPFDDSDKVVSTTARRCVI